MFRVLIMAFVVLVMLPCASEPVFARAMERGDATAARKATPAVVNISTWKVRPPAKPGDLPRRVKTYGSGFLIDQAGIIVTNKHVVDGALDITAILSDGERAHATLLAVAAMLDLAVLKVDVGHPLPVLKWGDSEALQVGDPVLTIGNPLGIGISVSAGIVSALNRDIQDTPFDQ
jgi:serine protease Do